ncbi:MAG: hypothetical protein FD123_2081 [Bacteroidetes bacterium]|nr:MAG: hypothetical protein FD123_2081 [Bacteroidota bacterium]
MRGTFAASLIFLPAFAALLFLLPVYSQQLRKRADLATVFRTGVPGLDVWCIHDTKNARKYG